MRLKFVFIFFLSISCFFAKGQTSNYRFINFSAKDGLLDKLIYSAVQDKKGYMWFGTATGLYRYDGHVFKYFRSPIDKVGSTISNILQAVQEDNDGHLWLGSLTSLQWYNPITNIFWKPNNKEVEAAFVVNFSNGKYTWVSTNKNFIYRFNKNDSSFLGLANQYPKAASVSSLSTVEAKGLLYDVHPEAIYVFTLDGKYTNTIPHLPADITGSFYAKEENVLYLSSYTSGVLKVDLTTLKITTIAPENKELKANNLLSIAKQVDGTIFLGGYPLHSLNPEKNEYLNFYTKEDKNEFSLAASKVVNIFTDRESNLWFCSHYGLSMLPWQNSQIKTLRLKDEITGFVTEPLGIFQEPNTNNLLVTNSSSSGLQYVNINTGQTTVISNTVETNKNKKAITNLIIAPDKNVYASDGTHFFKYNSTTKKLTPYLLSDQNYKPISTIGRNVTDSNGNIFITAINNGFYVWMYKTKKLTHYNKWDIINEQLVDEKDNNIAPCIVDNKQNIWFTSNDGVYEFRQSINKYIHHTPTATNDVAIMGASQYIAQDVLGHIWIATVNNGLYEMYYEEEKQIWKNFTTNSNIDLPADYFQKIKQNPNDSIMWISSISGLLKFDPINKKVLTIYNMQNGFGQDGSCNGFNVFSNKQLAALFYGKISLIDLNTYKLNTFKPKVVLSSIKVLNEEKYFLLDSNKATLSINNNQNYLQFEFAALVYNNGNKNQYAYMLEGADKEWIYCKQKNTASYSGLMPGTYLFKVKAANNDGVWGDETILKIIINPPFYKTWWFLLLCLLLIISLVYGWNNYRINQTKKQAKLKADFQQQIAETEMKALRAQMNPHFIFNSLNSIQKYILQNNHFEASQYLTKFSRLIRLILDHSNQNNILLSSEINLLKLYIEMEALRFDNKFKYNINVSNNLNVETTEMPAMLIQPYIENAIWHGLLHKQEKGNLLVDFNKNKINELVITIQDDGVGRQKAAELKSKQVLKKKSYGMQITKDRIEIINRIQNIHANCIIEDVTDNNGNTIGTKVILTIPIKLFN